MYKNLLVPTDFHCSHLYMPLLFCFMQVINDPHHALFWMLYTSNRITANISECLFILIIVFCCTNSPSNYIKKVLLLGSIVAPIF